MLRGYIWRKPSLSCYFSQICIQKKSTEIKRVSLLAAILEVCYHFSPMMMHTSIFTALWCYLCVCTARPCCCFIFHLNLAICVSLYLPPPLQNRQVNVFTDIPIFAKFLLFFTLFSNVVFFYIYRQSTDQKPETHPVFVTILRILRELLTSPKKQFQSRSAFIPAIHSTLLRLHSAAFGELFSCLHLLQPLLKNQSINQYSYSTFHTRTL